jgi:alkylation response protein AidB-like acyl-CoA dehydrogenase
MNDVRVPEHVTAESVRDRVRALGTLIDTSAAANEQATDIAPEVIEALIEVGVFKLMVPRVLGGIEANPERLIDVISEMSYHDGSTGWYAGAVMTAGAVSGALLGERAISAIFHSGENPLAAGQAAPSGKAERVGDSYRVSGFYSFGSGSPSARWIVGGFVLHENGTPVPNEAGEPTMLIGLVPRSTVEFLGNWDVLGLRGTASYDFRVQEQLLHEDFLFNPASAQVRRGGALYRMGFMALPCLTHASFAIGCARRALDEWRGFAKAKMRTPTLHANELQTFQRDFAVAQADLRSAEAYVRRTFSRLFEAAQSGTFEEDLKIDGRLCASNALAVGNRVAQMAHMSATTYALRSGNALQRCFRDLQAGNAHFLTGELSWIDAGKALAGLPGARITF